MRQLLACPWWRIPAGLCKPGRRPAAGAIRRVLWSFAALLVGLGPLSVPAQAQEPLFGSQAFAAGYQWTSPYLSGLSVKWSTGAQTSMQAIFWLQGDAQSSDLQAGLRVIRDLGVAGGLHRYAGLGGGVRHVQGGNRSSSALSAQGFIGVEIPWTFSAATRNLASALELNLSSYWVHSSPQGPWEWQATPGVGFGLHYWF